MQTAAAELLGAEESRRCKALSEKVFIYIYVCMYIHREREREEERGRGRGRGREYV
jgi:hypothetical protein